MKHYVIKPRSGWIYLNFREWIEFFDLFLILILRDVKLRYKQTVLGILWVIIQPLCTSLLFATIFGRIAHFSSEGIPYVLFAFGGMLPWFTFSQAVNRSSNSILAQSHLISKVYFPRIMIPAASCAASLLDFFINFVTLLVMTLAYGVPLTLNLAVVPLLLCIVMLFSLGIGLVFSALSVFYRDFIHLLPFMMQIWMFASPLVYSVQVVPEKWRIFFMINPLTGIIDGFRWALFSIGPFPWQSLAISSLASILMIGVGIFVFTRVERQFADVI